MTGRCNTRILRGGLMDGQTIFAVIIGAALACFSLVLVGYAFFRGDSTEDEGTAFDNPPASDTLGLEATYDAIDTLELEFQLGNIPEDQYRHQLQGYRVQAALAVKALLESGNAPPELLLEQEVLAARSNRANLSNSLAAPVQGHDSTHKSTGDWRACPQCDAPIPSPANLCPHCGADTANTTPLDGRGD